MLWERERETHKVSVRMSVNYYCNRNKLNKQLHTRILNVCMYVLLSCANLLSDNINIPPLCYCYWRCYMVALQTQLMNTIFFVVFVVLLFILITIFTDVFNYYANKTHTHRHSHLQLNKHAKRKRKENRTQLPKEWECYEYVEEYKYS